jgi:threonine dehydratase
MTIYPNLDGVKNASSKLKGLIRVTPLDLNKRLSNIFETSIFLKREDLQQIRSFKIRGAYNKISSLDPNEIKSGIICASAGNHAQGVAYSCQKLKINGEIYMPATTPKQKISQVRMFGGKYVKIILVGDTYDTCQKIALDASKRLKKTFVHPFDDPKVIEGQATIATEILNQRPKGFDYVIVPIGGGGLISGLITVLKKISPNTKIIGVEPEGAPSMKRSIEKGKLVSLKEIDKFVDGAAVKKVGDLTFKICKSNLEKIVLVPEGKICQTILDLYNKDGIVAEPAGALAVAALDYLKKEISNKAVCVILCGGNNDIIRMPEIKERALLFAELKHYFLVNFPQRSGALKQFVAEILGPNDDITHFRFTKKNFRDNAPAVVGIELKDPEDLKLLTDKMNKYKFKYDYLNENEELFQFLI